MRTIEAPGVEITEIDKSQYSPTIVGTTSLVMGFAEKGEDYEAQQMTSRSAWINYYGQPTNEAERYFYAASMEAIDRNGKLYCAKLPYENEARDKYAFKKYTISTKCEDINSVDKFISSDPNLVKLLDGDYTRYGYGLSDLPGLTAIDDPEGKIVLSTYAMTMMNIEKNIDILQKYNQKRNAKTMAVPVFYKYTITEEDDNWWYYNQVNAYARLSGLFDPNGEFWTKTKMLKPGRQVKFEQLNLSSLNAYLQDYMGEGVPVSGLYTPQQYVEAYVSSYADVFGKDATEYMPYNFNIAKLSSTDVATDNFQHFIKDNIELFKKIDCYVCNSDAVSAIQGDYELSDTTDIPFESLATATKLKDVKYVPYVYAEDNSPYNMCNLMAYYTAAKTYLEVRDIKDEDAINVISCLETFVSVREQGKELSAPFNKYLCSRWNVSYQETQTSNVKHAQVYLPKDTPDLDEKIKQIIGVEDPYMMSKEWFDTESNDVAPFINLSSSFVGSLSIPIKPTKDQPDCGITQEALTELLNDLEQFVHGQDNSKYVLIKSKLNVGKKVHTPYIEKLFDFYATNINITSFYDKQALYSTSSTIDTMKSTLSASIVDGRVQTDENGNEIVVKTGKSYFEVYGNVAQLSDYPELTGTIYEKNIQLLEIKYNKTISKSTLIDFIEEIRELDAFKEIEDYLARTPATYELYMKFNKSFVEDNLKYAELMQIDGTIKHFLKITSNNVASTLPISQIDNYKTEEEVVPPNQIYIVDITRAGYSKATDIDEHECVGIIPVVTTAANAMVVQSLIEKVATGKSYAAYQALSSIGTIGYSNAKSGINHSEFIINGDKNSESYNLSSFLAYEIFSDNPSNETISQEAAGYFNTIQFQNDGKLDRENMYDIGIVVFKAYVDPSEGNKITLNAVESFVGSLDRNAVNSNTNVTKFIDKIVNSQSEYINVFSNCFASAATLKEYKQNCDIFVVEPQKAATLGFYEDMMIKDISLAKSIYDGFEKIFNKNQDINDKEIDIVCDAGVSNIAQYISTIFGSGKGQYNPSSTDATMFKLKSRNDTLVWRTVLGKYDDFCKNKRKDCMFIADGLRPLCLQGQRKIVRPTKPENTIDANILPYIKFLTGINTNYGAGYCDWFQKSDDYTGEYYWCPPSVQAMGIYIWTDVNGEYWDAPAGLNRGIVNAVDVAFSPTMKQAGQLYSNNWNYAINYPKDGIVLEGQKTFQVKASAFDRINVRRMFLRLERATYKAARYFVYEGNTAYTRQRLIDALDPIFSDAKLRNGIYDYKIICDESINTSEVIDNNELKVKIEIKPVKTAEFLLVDFIALTTGGSFSEM